MRESTGSYRRQRRNLQGLEPVLAQTQTRVCLIPHQRERQSRPGAAHLSRAGHLRVKSTGDNPLYHEGEKPVVRVVRDALIIEVRQRGKKYTTVIPLRSR